MIDDYRISEPDPKHSELCKRLANTDGIEIQLKTVPPVLVRFRTPVNEISLLWANRYALGAPICTPEMSDVRHANNPVFYQAIDLDTYPPNIYKGDATTHPAVNYFVAVERMGRTLDKRSAAQARLEVLDAVMHGIADLSPSADVYALIRRKNKQAESVMLGSNPGREEHAQSILQQNEYSRLLKLPPQSLAEELNNTSLLIAQFNLARIQSVIIDELAKGNTANMQVVMPTVTPMFEVLNGNLVTSTRLTQKLQYDMMKCLATQQEGGLLNIEQQVNIQKVETAAQTPLQRGRQRIIEAAPGQVRELFPRLLPDALRNYVESLPADQREEYCLRAMFKLLKEEDTESQITKWGGYAVDLGGGFLIAAAAAVLLPASVGSSPLVAYIAENGLENSLNITRKYRHLGRVDAFLWYLEQLLNAREEQNKPRILLPIKESAFNEIEKEAISSRVVDIDEVIKFAIKDIAQWKTLRREISDSFPIWGLFHNPITDTEKKDNAPRLIALEKIYAAFARIFNLENREI